MGVELDAEALAPGTRRGRLVQGEPLEQIRAALAANRDGPLSRSQLCEACGEVLAASGVGVMLLSGGGAHGSLCTTGAVSALIEELQYTLGEGPCMDACRHGAAVEEPDLAEPVRLRWPGFSPPAIAAGVRAVFAFPLLAGAVRLGAIDVYMDRPGPLSERQGRDARLLADLVAAWVLDMQAGAPPGALAEPLDGGDFHLGVHNAAGMTSVQLGVSVAEALLRLRAHAFAEGRPLTDVAADVVARKLRIE